MGKLKLSGIGVLIILVLGGMWFYRPWSDYSPSRVLEGRESVDRTPYYRAMETYFPNRKIPASPTATPLERNLQPLNISYTYEGGQRDLDDYAARRAITGLMVVRDGQVILEKYWRGEGPDDQHTSWSVAKSFISTLIGIALKEGAIDDLRDPVVKYAPVYRGTDYGQTSLRHLLMMSSGIDFNEDYEDQGSDISRLFFNTFFLNRDIDKSIRQYKRNREPGTDFDYISTNTSVLGAVVSGAYGGRSLSDLVGEKVFNPLGMQEGSWLLDRNARTGKELAYCCLNIRLEDYAKFGLLYLNDGVANGQKILPDGWVDFVRTPAHKDLHTPSLGKPVGYGQHFWIPPERDGSFYAAGYNGQFVWVDPNTNTVVALTSADQTYPGQVEVLDLLRAAARADISDMSAKASEVDKDGARL